MAPKLPPGRDSARGSSVATKLTSSERALLERLCAKEQMTPAEALRRGLRALLAAHGDLDRSQAPDAS
jgi:hypothetical protein